MVNEDSRNEALMELHVLIVAPEAPRCGSQGCPVCKALCGLDVKRRGSSKCLLVLIGTRKAVTDSGQKPKSGKTKVHW